MAMPDVQGGLRRSLASALPDVEVRVSVPDPRPPTLVVVRREGGRRENALIDRAGVGIDCWAPTEADAYALADRVAGAMDELRFADGWADVSMESMRSDYDVVAKSPRWYLSYTIKAYKPKTS